jgi:hypothetical protein
VEEINLNGVMHLLQNINKEEIQGPNEEIDVLIGFEYTSYHPEREKSSGHLILFKNRFGRCLGGSHGNMADNTLKLITWTRSSIHRECKDTYEKIVDSRIERTDLGQSNPGRVKRRVVAIFHGAFQHGKGHV